MATAATNRQPGGARIVMAHGGGGELTRQLLAEHILPKLANEWLNPLMDSAVLPRPNGRICMTTDAYVVQPLEFPGGDIGRLAVCGTVNDLAVMGAEPLALSLALVMEEGLPLTMLDRVMASIAGAAAEAGVPVATGDTKVIERRQGDGLIITTAGIGVLPDGVNLNTEGIEPGDAIIISGRIAEHGLAVMSAREHLSFETELRSDAAPLNGLVAHLLAAVPEIKFLRDPTRGGVAGVFADLAEDTGLSIELEETAMPVSRTALHTAEMLGLDPLTTANEGKVVVVVPDAAAGQAAAVLRSHALGAEAAVVGRFTACAPPLVELITRSGGRRIVSRPYGEELPRIC